MLIADAMGDTKTRVEVPSELTCYRLNNRGKYEMFDNFRCSIDLDWRQVVRLWVSVIS